MKTKDVKEILDIPNIEKYLDCIFQFTLYIPGDKNMFYQHWIDENSCVRVDFMIDNHLDLIEGQKKLSDIIIIEDIGYFEMSVGTEKRIWDSNYGCYMTESYKLFQSHFWRPHIKENEKDY